ncbi:hypothetical protein HANVADRAFT_48445 [Hanseniaspora valbyensis NRRL Y-1626]|uniref:Uncharacterized protein n=1 Tax=Hanseniaspora valbyensis NRRL Y-1626 TaxID=766949 RepID=A0A1B7TEL4_9ASCO|nr:hypothetical protein HANVADRAFT_48445 [Hanseniaspora valbyensis NRRL Y-1626]
MISNNNNNKRRSLFFGGSNNNSNNNNSSRSITPVPIKPKSNFKTFSVIHVSNPDEYDASNPKIDIEETIIPSVNVDNNNNASAEKRPATVVRNSSSIYRSETSTVKPNLSMMSKRPPPPTVDISSIYDTINSTNGNVKKHLLMDDVSSSIYVNTPVGKDMNYELFSEKAIKEANEFPEVFKTPNKSFENPFEVEDEEEEEEEEEIDDEPSFTNSDAYVEVNLDNNNGSAFIYASPYEDDREEEENAINNDFTVSSGYNINTGNNNNQHQSLLSDFTRRHNRERSQLEEYLEELEEFNLSDDNDTNNESTENNGNRDFTNMNDTTIDYTENTILYPTNNDNESTTSSKVSDLFVVNSGGLKVVNAESDDHDSILSSHSNDHSNFSADDNSSISSDSSFDDKHSQLSAVKSLYHSEDDGLLVDQGSLPSLPYTLENNLSYPIAATETTPSNKSLNNSSHLNESLIESLSPDNYLSNEKKIDTNGIQQQYQPKSIYIAKLLHKYPTTNKSSFNFTLPLNLQSNPVEDINAKTAVVKHQRKSNNIKHKTAKKKLLSNEEPTPIEFMKGKAGGLNSHIRSDIAHNQFLGDIDEEEMLILQNLPGSEGYQENSLLTNNFEINDGSPRKNRKRADTTKSYYTRNVNRLRTETISTIDTMNNVNTEGLQVTNPDDIYINK